MQFLRQWGIASRLTFLVLLGAATVLLLTVGYTYIAAEQMLKEEVEEKTRYLVQATAGRIEVVERSVQKVTLRLADSLTYSPHATEDIYDLLKRNLAQNPEIFGSCVAFAPTSATDSLLPEAPYVYRMDGQLLSKSLSVDDYRYDVWDWYTLPRDLGHAVWGEPYFDEGGGNMVMVTYSVPLTDSAGKFRGVVTSDVSLEWLTDLLSGLKLGDSGYAFLISGNGSFISHPWPKYIMRESIFSLAESSTRPGLRELGREMVELNTGFIPYDSPVTHISGWLAYAPVPSPGWSLAVVFPREEIMGDVIALTRTVVLVGLLGLVVLMVLIVWIARSITHPLRQLDKTACNLVNDLDTPLAKIPGNDEVSHLAESFERMRTDLKQHIVELAEATAARERIESELQIARSIQMSLVPKTFPPYPDLEEIEVFALLDPAREVGGDFYDFFMPDDNTFCMVIGDVTGKGVPAALFMAVTRTFLKSIWKEEPDPAIVLEKLNMDLAEGNESSMFVTLFCASIDLRTGHLRYARGGHNPPFVLPAQGKVEMVPFVRGALVGAIPGGTYEAGELQLGEGDGLFLYTDGVTEAMNPEEEMFGEPRTIAALEELKSQNTTRIAESIREQISLFAGEAVQSDDVTMLVFRYRPNPSEQGS